MRLPLAFSFALTLLVPGTALAAADAPSSELDAEAPTLSAAEEDEEEEEDEFDFIKAGEEAAKEKEAEKVTGDDFDFEEDDEFADFQVASKPKKSAAPPPMAKGALPDIIGADKLTNAYAPTVASPGAGVVLLELPVLVAHDPSDFDGRAFWVVTDIYADGMKVGSARSEVRRETLSTAGPSFVFVKVQVPVPSESGELEIKVGKATASGGQAEPLYTRKVSYQTR